METKKLSLKNVTLIGVDCVDIDRLIRAAKISAQNIDFGAIKLLSSVPSKHPWVVPILPVTSEAEYSALMIRKLASHVSTDFALIIQHDGFVLNAQAWNKDFLKYDYIGAPWIYLRNTIGQGGFSLRSKRLLDLLARSKEIKNTHPEDTAICIRYRKLLESKGIKFAPLKLAEKFSLEGNFIKPYSVWDGQFGFHNQLITDITKWKDYKKYAQPLEAQYPRPQITYTRLDNLQPKKVSGMRNILYPYEFLGALSPEKEAYLVLTDDKTKQTVAYARILTLDKAIIVSEIAITTVVSRFNAYFYFCIINYCKQHLPSFKLIRPRSRKINSLHNLALLGLQKKTVRLGINRAVTYSIKGN